MLATGAGNAFSLLIANILGVIFNFHTFGKLVFRSHEYRRIVRFTLVYAAIYATNLALLELLNATGLESRLAQACLVVPVALASWVLNKHVVFRSCNEKQTI
jgi:putative flippase GtrA